jgi:cytochrome c oxidase subunit II
MWNLTLSFGVLTLTASIAVVAVPENKPPAVTQLVHWTGDTRAPRRDPPDRTPAQIGEFVMRRYGCLQCHTVDGSAKVGPSLQGVWGRVRMFRDGSSLVADEAYLRESILEPNRHIVDGFSPGMPGYAGKLRERELGQIIEYLKTLSPADAASNSAPLD